MNLRASYTAASRAIRFWFRGPHKAALGSSNSFVEAGTHVARRYGKLTAAEGDAALSCPVVPDLGVRWEGSPEWCAERQVRRRLVLSGHPTPLGVRPGVYLAMSGPAHPLP